MNRLYIAIAVLWPASLVAAYLIGGIGGYLAGRESLSSDAFEVADGEAVPQALMADTVVARHFVLTHNNSAIRAELDPDGKTLHVSLYRKGFDSLPYRIPLQVVDEWLQRNSKE